MPGPDLETPLLAEALRREGVAAQIAVWREPRDWGRASLVLLRTPWDYPGHLQEFLAWTSRVAAVTSAGTCTRAIYSTCRRTVCRSYRRGWCAAATRPMRKSQRPPGNFVPVS